MDVMELKERQLVNKKAEVLTYANIVANKDLEINGLRAAKNLMVKQFYQSEKELKRAKRKAWWRGFQWGVVVGAGGVVALVVSGY